LRQREIKFIEDKKDDQCREKFKMSSTLKFENLRKFCKKTKENYIMYMYNVYVFKIIEITYV